jgi:diketogulonate reductase-like aldo/keto reductase
VRRRALLQRAALAALGAAGFSAGLAADGAARPAQAAGLPRTRAVPSTGEALPVVGLGTWRTFAADESAAGRARLGEVLRRFLAAGGRVIDTAPMYAPAEQVLGELLPAPDAPGAQPWLASKVWTSGRAAGIAQMEQSLRLLRRRRVALIQVHNLLDWRTQLATLREWKAAGRIAYVGVTHYSEPALEAMAEIVAREQVDFVQCAYSVAERGAERRLLPLAAERGTAVLTNRPFVEGAAFRKVRGLDPPPWAEDFGAKSWAQVFLKYVIAHPAVTCALAATANPRHVEDNLAAAHGPLPTVAQRRQILAAWQSL